MLEPEIIAPPPILAPPASAPAAPPRPWGFWPTIGLTFALAAGYLGVQVVFFLFYAIWLQLNHQKFPTAKEIEASGFLLSVPTTMAMPVAVGLSILFAWLRRGITVRDYLGLFWPDGKTVRKWFAWMLVFLVVGDALTVLLKFPVSPDFMVNIYRHPGFLPLLIFAVVVAAPIAEEFMFRGFLFAGLQNSWLRGPGAILITSVIWAAIHTQYDIYGVSTIFLTGLLLGLVRLRTRSLFLCILLHATMNLYSTIEVAIYVAYKY